MHNKLFIADGVFAIAGGRNIADEYFFRSPRGNFIDFDLLVAGDAVPELAASASTATGTASHVYTLDALEPDAPKAEGRREEFERATASADMLFAPIMAGARDFLNYGPLSPRHGPAAAEDAARPDQGGGRTDPDKVSGESASGMDPTTVISHVTDAIDHAHDHVLLASPYFVPGKTALERIYKVRQQAASP